jgi:DNA-binding CsgD family transcriptional regulator
MTRSIDSRLAIVDRWYAAYDGRDIEAMCALADAEIDTAPVGPLFSELQGAMFHGHVGVRSMARWSYDTFPRLRLEHSDVRTVPNGILASTTFIVDDRSNPAVKRHTESLFDISGAGRIRRIRSFLSGSQALDKATDEAVLTTREREIFQLLAEGLTGSQIAERLVLSPATVRTHVQNGMSRLGASTRLHAFAIAAKGGDIHL